MTRRSIVNRAAALVALLVQLALQSGVAWRDARAEGEGVGRCAHVESLDVRHAGSAHAGDCAVSQHLQTHSSPAARLRAATAATIPALAPPPQPTAAPPATASRGWSSRGPPSPA
jgi:hypothetical protein